MHAGTIFWSPVTPHSPSDDWIVYTSFEIAHWGYDFDPCHAFALAFAFALGWTVLGDFWHICLPFYLLSCLVPVQSHPGMGVGFQNQTRAV
jgi:hypothetical protein